MVGVGSARVNPTERYVIVEYSPVSHLRSALHLSVIEPVRRETHDLFVHAVLGLQQPHHLGFLLRDVLHERHTKPCFQCGNAFYGGRKLTVVACEHHPVGSPYGYPACGFESLCRLVDEECVVFLTVKQFVCRTGQRRGNHPGVVEQLVLYAQFYLCRPAFQALQLLVIGVSTGMTTATQFANGFPQCPQLRIVGMTLKLALIGKGQHLVGHPCRIADA